jgi:hypothetical protein
VVAGLVLPLVAVAQPAEELVLVAAVLARAAQAV